jgi:hypothetical protein
MIAVDNVMRNPGGSSINRHLPSTQGGATRQQNEPFYMPLSLNIHFTWNFENLGGRSFVERPSPASRSGWACEKGPFLEIYP